MTIPDNLLNLLSLISERYQGEVATAILAYLLHCHDCERGIDSEFDVTISAPEAQDCFNVIRGGIDHHRQRLMQRRQRNRKAAKQMSNADDPTPEIFKNLLKDPKVGVDRLLTFLASVTRAMRCDKANQQLDKLTDCLIGDRMLMEDALCCNPDITLLQYARQLIIATLIRKSSSPATREMSQSDGEIRSKQDSLVHTSQLFFSQSIASKSEEERYISPPLV